VVSSSHKNKVPLQTSTVSVCRVKDAEYLKLSQQKVLSHAVVLAASSIQTVTELQNRGDQGAGCLITHLNCQIHWLNTGRRPHEDTITFKTHTHTKNCIVIYQCTKKFVNRKLCSKSYCCRW